MGFKSFMSGSLLPNFHVLFHVEIAQPLFCPRRTSRGQVGF